LMDSGWQAQWKTELSPSISQPELWTRPYVEQYFAYEAITLPPNSEENLTYQEVLRRWGSTLQNLLLSESDEDFDIILDEFNQIKKTEKYRKLVQLQTSLMQRNKKKLGI
ncbi:MAG: ABC transporter substrate-binding protein, partial [Treponema sp.]|nr:ABC transporter substrate-binding protein [Treponema sp.]